jgi:hypothetical protein
MEKFILTVLIVGLWGTVGAECGDLTDEDVDSLFVKHCRMDTIGWVAKVCETHFRWEYSAPNYGSDCIRQDGMAISPAADRLVWNRKEKPSTMQWVVRTKETCWYVLIETDIGSYDSNGEIKGGEIRDQQSIQRSIVIDALDTL